MSNKIKLNTTPFFTENVLASIKIGLGLSLLVVICFWPGSRFLNFGFTQGTPLIFPVYYIFSLVFSAHHMLCYAKGDYGRNEKDNNAGNFLSVAAALMRQVVVFHFILCPFYLTVAAVSGLSVMVFCSSLAVVLLSALVCGALGGVAGLLFNPDNLWGFLFSRLGLVLYLAATGWVHPVLNPVFLLFRFYRVPDRDPVVMAGVMTHGLFCAGLMAWLLVTAALVVRHQGRKDAANA